MIELYEGSGGMTADGVGRALVLGGGGVAGVAWEAGMITGLRDAGADLTAADLIVGTSAGSIVGSLIGHGVDVADAVDRMAAEAVVAEPSDASPAQPHDVDMDAVLAAFGILFDPGLDPQEARAKVGALALAAQVDGAAVRLEEI